MWLSQHSALKCDELCSNFAFNLSVRRYIMERAEELVKRDSAKYYRFAALPMVRSDTRSFGVDSISAVAPFGGHVCSSAAAKYRKAKLHFVRLSRFSKTIDHQLQKCVTQNVCSYS